MAGGRWTTLPITVLALIFCLFLFTERDFQNDQPSIVVVEPDKVDNAYYPSPLNSRGLLSEGAESKSYLQSFSFQRFNRIPEDADSSESDDAIEKILNVDSTPSLNEIEAMTLLQKKLPNLPYELSTRFKNRMTTSKVTCAKFPSVYDLKFNNGYWQVLATTNGTFYLYAAYYDDRALNIGGPSIRILGMIDRIEPNVTTNCQLWFQDDPEPVVTPVLEYKFAWVAKWGNNKQGILQPYLITCKVPEKRKGQVPLTVSLVEKPCDVPYTNLRVINERPAVKGKFAVCVKGMDFLDVDLSVKLTEWIELLGILGAEKIFLYELEVHPNISKVLKYYEEMGRVVVTPISQPGEMPNIPGFRHRFLKAKLTHKRQTELIPYNDCLYRNLYSYEYIALLDIDEVIMPLKANNWRELMDAVKVKANTTRDSYNFRNAYFWDNIKHKHTWNSEVPKYMHMLQHTERALNHTIPGQYVKCFHNPERVLTLHNHFPFSCLEKCQSYAVPTEDAQLQHYRADCVGDLKNCTSVFKDFSVTDSNILRFQGELVARVNETLRVLEFFRKP